MKIGIIAAHHIRFSPYIFYYTKILEELGFDYELIIPNKMGIIDEFSHKVHLLPWNPQYSSLINYFLYANKVVKVIDYEKYDALIILTTVNASYLAPYLSKKYKKKYIVDIRDYTHENNRFYFFLESMGIRNAKLNVISSSKFTEFLPVSQYVVCHNINFEIKDLELLWKKPGDRIIIGHVGSISYKEQCKKLINLVKEDDRFEFHIYGKESKEKEIENIVSGLKCDRIRYFGAYLPADKEKIIPTLDILFNTYGNKNPLLDYALSNKLYDAMYYKKLLLTSPCTYMEEVGGKIAYSLDYDTESELDLLYEWVRKLRKEVVENYQNTMLQRFIQDNITTESKIKNILIEWTR